LAINGVGVVAVRTVAVVAAAGLRVADVRRGRAEAGAVVATLRVVARAVGEVLRLAEEVLSVGIRSVR
jgi:hypothetical protein